MSKQKLLLCPFCSKASCDHCWECGELVNVADHLSSCSSSTNINPLTTLLPEIICQACEDTGYNSHGRKCFPCLTQGRIK